MKCSSNVVFAIQGIENIVGKGENAGNQHLLFLPQCKKLFKILDWSKFTAFADNKINVNEQLNFGLGRVENIV